MHDLKLKKRPAACKTRQGIIVFHKIEGVFLETFFVKNVLKKK